MMSLPSSVSKSLFHQFMLLFIPGSLVVVPFMMIIYLAPVRTSFPQLLDFYNNNPGFVYFISFILIFLIGLLLENIGSVIEYIYDQLFKVSTPAWEFFLFSKCDGNNVKVVHKYIDTIVFRYKCELSLIPAWIIFIIEWHVIYLEESKQITPDLFYTVLFISIFCFFINAWQSTSSCKLLNNIRIRYMEDTVKIVLCRECGKEIPTERCIRCNQEQ